MKRIRSGYVAKLVAGMMTAALMAVLISCTIKQIGVWRDSMSLWTRVIDQGAEVSHVAYNNRGVAYSEKGEFLPALEDFNKAIQVLPVYDEAIFNRGLVLEKLGRIKEALQDYNQAIALMPAKYYDLYSKRGLLYDGTGRANNAVLNSFNLGILYRDARQPAKAIESFSAALAIDHNFAPGYFYRGVVYSLQGETEKAVRDFTATIELNPNEAKAYYLRGNIYTKIGKMELARSDFQRSCGLGNSDACNALR